MDKSVWEDRDTTVKDHEELYIYFSRFFFCSFHLNVIYFKSRTKNWLNFRFLLHKLSSLSQTGTENWSFEIPQEINTCKKGDLETASLNCLTFQGGSISFQLYHSDKKLHSDTKKWKNSLTLPVWNTHRHSTRMSWMSECLLKVLCK